jgi:hypothetical protein
MALSYKHCILLASCLGTRSPMCECDFWVPLPRMDQGLDSSHLLQDTTKAALLG